ncbi:amidohydrolase [Haloimpatiens sp. FM7330]|uniref:amidohydrolase n=1 Tax=Haloimpatiens sp. FM7330 TaxID=3298610 RepID=UPI00362EF591
MSQIKELISEKCQLFEKINDDIWEYAETKFEEYNSCKAQIRLLEEEGFKVTKNLANIETAFYGSYGCGKPVIAVLGEFDALPDLSQEADVFEKKATCNGGNGHGCGHNTLGAASLQAAVCIKDYIKKNNLNGTIRYYGCPGEENGGGKVFLVRDGYFDDVDFGVTWHPASLNCVLNDGFLANIKAIFNFKGVTSHAAASPELGRSALDGLELMNVGINFMREHMIDDARVHYAITNTGGIAPNVVQANAQGIYNVRAPKLNQVIELFERVKNIAKGAALMTDTTVDYKITAGYSDYIANSTLSKIMEKHAKDILEKVEYTEEEYEYASKIQSTFKEELVSTTKIFNYNNSTECIPIVKNLFPAPKKIPGSSDVGDVSWVIPMAQFSGSCYAFGTPAHSWQLVSQGKSSIAHKGMKNAALVMALTVIEVLENSKLLDQIKKDHEEKLNGSSYVCPIDDTVKPFIS